jgi:hypothetical protein
VGSMYKVMNGANVPSTQVPPSQQTVMQSTAVWHGMSVGVSTAVCCVSRADYRSDGGEFEIVLVADETGLTRGAGKKLRADLQR